MIVNNIKYINDPKPGGKYGSIKTAQGITIMVPPDLLPGFRVGMSCEISTKQQTWGTGTPDERLVTIATSGPTGPVQAQGVQAGYQGANQGPANPRPNTGFQPRVVQGGGRPGEAQPDQARHIFITGVVGRAMGSGKFTASEIPVLTQAAGEAYDRLLDRTRPAAAVPATPPPDVPGFEPGDPGPGLQ